jgi:hypothetical protein
MSVIIEARNLWDVLFLNGIPTSALPTPEDISQFTKDMPYVDAPGYSEKRVLTARTIFAAHMSICQHSLIQDPRKDWYKKEDGNIEEVNTLASVWERAVDMARYSHAYGYIDLDTPDYDILAILAISEAWDAAENILYYREPEDDRLVIKAVQEAQDLLAKALELKNEEIERVRKRTIEDQDKVIIEQTQTIDRKEKTLKKIKPLADERKRQQITNRNKAILTNELKRQKREPIIEILKKEVNDITRKNKNLSPERIINRIIERRKVNYSPRHLRRLIKENKILPTP